MARQRLEDHQTSVGIDAEHGFHIANYFVCNNQHITQNRRVGPLVSYEVIIKLTANAVASQHPLPER